MSRAVVTATAALLAAIVGFGLGWGSTAAPDAPPAERAAVSWEVPTASVPVAPPPDADGCWDVVQPLAEALDAYEYEAYGEPVPFPDDLDEAFRPAAFTKRMQEVQDDCAELTPRLITADCDEYPCATLWLKPQGAPDERDDCAPWSRVPVDRWHGTYGSGWMDANGERVALQVLVVHPEGWMDEHPGKRLPVSEHGFSRLDLRRQRMIEDALATWDLRARTAVERAEDLVFSYQDRIESPEFASMRDHLEELLREAEAKLDELRAAE